MSLMEMLLWIFGVVIVICLFLLRATVVVNAYKDWNYFVYKYKSFKLMQQSNIVPKDIDKNLVNIAECWMVIFMVWKLFPDQFFDYKPDWWEIHEKYYLKKS